MSLRTWQRDTNKNVYKIVILDSRTEKNFAGLKRRFSKTVWERMLTFLTTTPKEGKKVMQVRKYNLPDACRIVYDVIEKEDKNAVHIVCAGDHNEYERWLDKYGKKK